MEGISVQRVSSNGGERFVDNLPYSKTPYAVSGSLLYLALRNVTPTLYVTASIEDFDALAEYRWRWVNGRAVTVEQQTTQHLYRTMDSLLMGVEPNVTVVHKNRNERDYTRPNLTFTSSTVPNQYLLNGNFTYLILRDAQSVVIDTEDKQRVEQYSWRIQRTEGKTLILATYRENDTRKRMRLNRLVLGLTPTDYRTVIHQNGDIYDCRKSNLSVEPYHQEKKRTPPKQKPKRIPSAASRKALKNVLTTSRPKNKRKGKTRGKRK